MDSKIVTIDQFAMVMASIQEAIASLCRMIDGQQVLPQDGAQYDPTVPPPPPLSQSAPQAIPFTLHYTQICEFFVLTFSNVFYF